MTVLHSGDTPPPDFGDTQLLAPCCHADKARQRLIQELSNKPGGWSFFAAVRLAQSMRGALPPVGTAEHYDADVVRFQQQARLSFAGTEIAGFSSIDAKPKPPFTLSQSPFGLFGPNGPLPHHITEDAVVRRNGPMSERALAAFCDVLQHRLVSLVYRAWVAADPAASLDLGKHNPFARYIDSVLGTALPGFKDRTALPDDLGRYFAGILSMSQHTLTGCEAVLSELAGARVMADGSGGAWLAVSRSDRSRLASRRQHRMPGTPARLGYDTLLGGQAYTLGSIVRLQTEPVGYRRYLELLPGSPRFEQIAAAARRLLGPAAVWELRPVLTADAVLPPCAIGLGGRRLGRDAWLSGERRRQNGDDIRIRSLSGSDQSRVG